MGLLAQIGGGIGESMMLNVENNREDARAAAARQHEETLQRMRDQAAGTRQESSQDFEMQKYGVAREDALTDQDNAARAAGAARAEDRQWALADLEDEQAHEVELKLMDKFFESLKESSSSSKDGKWEISKLSKGEYTPDGILIDEEKLVVTNDSGLTFMQQGTNMLAINMTPEEEAKVNMRLTTESDVIKKATRDLMATAGTEEDLADAFLTAYGFLPTQYFEKIAKTRSNGTRWERFRESFGGAGAGGNKAPNQGGALSAGFQAANEMQPLQITDKQRTSSLIPPSGPPAISADGYPLGQIPE